jgi:replicative DNA helicase
MSRLNKKSTKAAFVKELQILNSLSKKPEFTSEANKAIESLVKLAKELEIVIKPEEYKAPE